MFWWKKFGSKKFWVKFFLGQTNFWVKQILGSKKKFGSKNFLGQTNFWVKQIFGSNFFLGQTNCWVKKCWDQKNFESKISFVKKIWVRKFFCLKKPGRVNPRGGYMTPPQKKVGLKLCCIDVSFVRWGRLQNFRPLGPLFLVEVEFLGVVGGVNSNNHVKPNLSLSLSWVVVRLGFWQIFQVCFRIQDCLKLVSRVFQEY